MSYTHITEEERYQIYELRIEGKTLGAIGEALGRDKSTISRELRRNRGKRGYRPKQAQQFAKERGVNRANGRRVTEEAWCYAQERLKEGWSPEQIAGRLVREKKDGISHETVYQRVYADKRAGGGLWTHLRCQKQRRKRYGGGRERRGQIPNRVSIDERPKVVDHKRRVGDWEGDTVIGARQQQAIVTVVERKTQFLVAGKVERKTAEAVGNAMLEQLRPLKDFVCTLTMDNGKEFARHEAVAEGLEAKTYFAHPYASWERGLNEQVNGLLRQYFPKSSRFDNLTHDDIQRVVEQINNRPRKRLGYKTPREALLHSANRRGVALRV